MRKTIAILVLAVALLFCSNGLKAQTAESDLRTNLSRATLGLYQAKQECKWVVTPSFFFEEHTWTCEVVSHFRCTATVFSTDGDGDYLALTAGHCFDWDHINEYYVSDEMNEHPVLRKVKVIKFEDNDKYDYGVVRFHSAFTDYPTIHLDPNFSALLDTKVVNVNFSLGVVKQFSEGRVVSAVIGPTEGPCKGCRGRFFVNVNIGPGASGSAIVNAETGKIIGIVEIAFPGTQMAILAIPTGKNLTDFMDDDSVGVKPKKEEPLPVPPVAPVKKKCGLFHKCK